MNKAKPKVTPIAQTNDYPNTLKAIPVGETRNYEMVGKVYHSLLSAIYRAKAAGYDFSYSTDEKNNLLVVTRNK